MRTKKTLIQEDISGGGYPLVLVGQSRVTVKVERAEGPGYETVWESYQTGSGKIVCIMRHNVNHIRGTERSALEYLRAGWTLSYAERQDDTRGVVRARW